MILKGRWETEEKDGIAHFLFNQIPPTGSVAITVQGLKMLMNFKGGKLVRFEVNGLPLKHLWEIKGALLLLLHSNRANFLISDSPPLSGDDFAIPFHTLVLEVMTLKDEITTETLNVLRDAFVKLKGIPRGGDEEEFVRTLRLRYKRGATVNEILRDFPHVFPGYIAHLISRLLKGGYVELTNPAEGGLNLSPLWIFVLAFLVSALSGCLTVFTIIKAL